MTQNSKIKNSELPCIIIQLFDLKKLPQYWDNAATTPVDKRVLDAMLPYFSEIFGNASSNHIYGKQAKVAIDKARENVAHLINASSSEVYFTSGATESINWALKGFLEANPEKGNHIITVKTEHKAVLNTCEYLESKGFEVTYLDVNENGLIDPDDLERSIKSSTALVAVMYVNNEIGVIQDIAGIAEICSRRNVVFFSDATQAVGKIPVDVMLDGVDLLCFSGHKFNGPKGIGVLYIKKGLKLESLIHGGGQEQGLRGGTYNTPLIVGLGEAARIIREEGQQIHLRLVEERERIERYLESNQIAVINFKGVNKAPHIISATLLSSDAEDFIIEHAGDFSISTGSACASSVIQNSHVIEVVFSTSNNRIIRISI